MLPPDYKVKHKRHLTLNNREIYSVRSDQVNAMLLNQFLKEHRKVFSAATVSRTNGRCHWEDRLV
jgi:hypothetical protein